MVIANNHNRPSYPMSSNLILSINNNQITKTLNPTVLGITLDPGLTFKYHFDQIKRKCNSKIRLIQTLTSKHFGINKSHLINIYKSTILSLFQYSMIPYYVASKKIQKSIQTIQNKILRIIFRPPLKTKTKTLHKLANLTPIHERLEKLVTNYLNKATENPTIQEVHDEYNLLDHKSHRAAHLSVLDQQSLID